MKSNRLTGLPKTHSGVDKVFYRYVETLMH
jgi:hypothetical protein